MKTWKSEMGFDNPKSWSPMQSGDKWVLVKKGGGRLMDPHKRLCRGDVDADGVVTFNTERAALWAALDFNRMD